MRAAKSRQYGRAACAARPHRQQAYLSAPPNWKSGLVLLF
jgi:hypothetical protein